MTNDRSTSSPTYGKVIKAYDSPYTEPAKMCKGEIVSISDKKSEFEGWLWCTTQKGVERWVPESIIKRNGDTGSLTSDYNAAELNVEVDERLTIISVESSWLLCRNTNGQTGWVPASHVVTQTK